MITEIVSFPLPQGITRGEALALYRTTADKWSNNKDLIRKYYHFDEERSLGGGVYIWPSREVADRWHGDAYKEMVRNLYGAYPSIQIFELLIDVDPAQASFTEPA